MTDDERQAEIWRTGFAILHKTLADGFAMLHTTFADGFAAIHADFDISFATTISGVSTGAAATEASTNETA